MNEKFTTEPQEATLSDERKTELHFTRGGLTMAALIGAGLGAGLGVGIPHAADKTLTPEEVVSFTVKSDVNPSGNIYELQEELADALSGTDISPDSIAGITGVGQQLEDGSNEVAVMKNTFHTWVELKSTPDSEE